MNALRKIAALVFAAAAALLPLSACGEGEKPTAFAGNYVLRSACFEGGADCTEDFLAYTASFSEEGTCRVVVNYLNLLETRVSRFTFDGETVTELYGEETYLYRLSGDTLTTSYGGDITVVLEKEKEEEDTVLPVDFEGVLFGKDMAESKFYNYCPAVIEEEENGQDVMHVWYCTNRDTGVIMDYIGYRKGVRQADGKWLFGEESIALSPTPETWDSRHACDPAVVRGSFRYRGETYGLLMAYLGCITDDYGQNETGIAVANAPEGPWVKIEELNPLIPWQDGGINETYDQSGKLQFNWGTGQPTLINLDGAGDILLTYQSGSRYKGARGTGVQRWNFSDLDALIASENLQPAFTVTLGYDGIVNSQGASCRIPSPDFVWDEEAERLYVCCATNEKLPADITKTNVNSHCLVAYLEGVDSAETLVSTLFGGSYTWHMLGHIGPADTGYVRNHNPGFVRDGYGRLPAGDSAAEEIRVIVSTGHNDWPNENIFTYRLYGTILNTKPSV